MINKGFIKNNLSDSMINKLRKEIISILEDYDLDSHLDLSDIISPALIESIIFIDEKTKIIDYPVIRKLAPGFTMDLIKKLDLKGVSFKNFDVTNKDFSGSKGIVINPQEVYKKSFKSTILNSVTIDGSFDNVCIEGTNFTKSIGAKIDFEKLNYVDEENRGITSNLIETNLCDAEIINFLNPKIINPRTKLNGAIIKMSTIMKLGMFEDDFETITLYYYDNNKMMVKTGIVIIDDIEEFMEKDPNEYQTKKEMYERYEEINIKIKKLVKNK